MHAPPDHLGTAGRQLWESTAAAVSQSEAMLAILERYCSCADALADAQQVLAAEGRYYRAGELVRRHPAADTEAEQHRLMQGYARQLGLSQTIRRTQEEKRRQQAQSSAKMFAINAGGNLNI
ncbi:MAG: hypothetical protein GXZ05_12835 [Gammaproteobacteria bacterium]|nr:hypothetical protein [Gammaproteobacteria bacterium]